MRSIFVFSMFILVFSLLFAIGDSEKIKSGSGGNSKYERHMKDAENLLSTKQIAAATKSFRDATDKLHSFWKSDLREYKKDLAKSPMPSYRGKLTAAEVDDLVAYLASLQEAK